MYSLALPFIASANDQCSPSNKKPACFSTWSHHFPPENISWLPHTGVSLSPTHYQLASTHGNLILLVKHCHATADGHLSLPKSHWPAPADDHPSPYCIESPCFCMTVVLSPHTEAPHCFIQNHFPPKQPHWSFPHTDITLSTAPTRLPSSLRLVSLWHTEIFYAH